MPRGRKFSPEQIIATLRQIEVQLAQGRSRFPSSEDFRLLWFALILSISPAQKQPVRSVSDEL